MKLNELQNKAVNLATELPKTNADVLIIKGYAGTGKTTIVKEIIKRYYYKDVYFKLAATTGRAAQILNQKLKEDLVTKQILEEYSAHLSEKMMLPFFEVQTVHSMVYTLSSLPDIDLPEKSNAATPDENEGKLQFKPITNFDSGVIIIDEASMLSDIENTSDFANYGSGNLLLDLFEAHPNFKFIFLGDPCQLPPVGQNFSPALSKSYLEDTYNKSTNEIELQEIIRQEKESGITKGAMILRLQSENKIARKSPKWHYFYLKGLDNIEFVTENYFTENYLKKLLANYQANKQDGIFHTLKNVILIVPTNKLAFQLNKHIRETLYGPENAKTLQPGDILQVTQNSHKHRLTNGEFVQVTEIFPLYKEVAGLKFRNVTLRRLNSDEKINTYIIEDVLYGGKTNISKQQHQNLFIDFYKRMKQAYPHKKFDKDFLHSQLIKDDIMNAVRAVFGYSITCHKAQGGEWDNVYIFNHKSLQFSYLPYNWMYTAFTRARKKIITNEHWSYKPYFNIPGTL